MATADFEQVKDLVAKYGDKQTIGRMAALGMIEPTTAVLAGMMIDRITQQNMQSPTTTVAQDVLTAPQPPMQPGQPDPAMQGQPQPGMPPQPDPMLQQPQPQPQMMRAGGVAMLDIPDDMYDSYAGGGVVAFSNGGAASMTQQLRLLAAQQFGNSPEIMARINRMSDDQLREALAASDGATGRGEESRPFYRMGPRNTFLTPERVEAARGVMAAARARQDAGASPSFAETALDPIVAPDEQMAQPRAFSQPKLPQVSQDQIQQTIDALRGAGVTIGLPQILDITSGRYGQTASEIIQNFAPTSSAAAAAARAGRQQPPSEIALPSPSGERRIEQQTREPSTPAAPAPSPEQAARTAMEQAKSMLGDRPSTEVETMDQARARREQAIRAAGGDPEVFKNQADELRAKRDELKGDRTQAANMRLIEAGLAIMGGESPYAFVNIGKGASQAMKGFAEDVKDLRKSRIELDTAERALNLAQTDYATKQTDAAMGMVERSQARVDKAQESYEGRATTLTQALMNQELGYANIASRDRATAESRAYRRSTDQRQLITDIQRSSDRYREALMKRERDVADLEFQKQLKERPMLVDELVQQHERVLAQRYGVDMPTAPVGLPSNMQPLRPDDYKSRYGVNPTR
jgi:hypothetical protein